MRIACLVCLLGIGLTPPPRATAGLKAAGASGVVAGRFSTMGTFVEIKIATPPGRADEGRRAVERARKAIEAFVDEVSSWEPDSETSRVNANAGRTPVRIGERLMNLLLHAREISQLSGGAFDVTFSPVARIWKLRPLDPVIPDDEAIARVLKLVGYKDLVLDREAGTAFLRRPGMRIDLGGIAKGSAIDVAAASLKADGFTNVLINAGGDLYAMGAKANGPWMVGIRNPRGARHEAIGRLPLCDRAITTSGDYEKMIEIDGRRYHHIINPKTGQPADRCVSVTVIAPAAEVADALSTALFVLGPKDGLALCERLDDVEALFVDTDFHMIRSSGFPEILGLKPPE
jgi:thiamine biosynthesis lipoprotein